MAIPVEPQVLRLLCLLIQHRDRVVTRQECIERVWGGRSISDAAVSSRIRSARQVLGDDGEAQRLIRTIHGVGFRFVGDVKTANDEVSSRPGIAVLPFQSVGSPGADPALADGLPADLITELSRLHWLFVIARTSSFRLRGADADIETVGKRLNVRYCLSGVVESRGRAMTVSVELGDTQDRAVIWSDRFHAAPGDVHEVREKIVRAVINSLEIRIPSNEAQRARLMSPEQLDAWSAYHLGLHHMYRFTSTDNSTAAGLFERAIAMEPGFARAYAGLSFTRFQDAFLRYSPDAAVAIASARHCAEQALERDPVDPFGNFVMGRSFWLHGELEGSIPWLERANLLNPNYAQATYARAWVDGLLGNGRESLSGIDAAVARSPLDPLLYGMLGVRAFSYLGLGDFPLAAHWAERAATSPGAHALIEAIAAVAHGLNGSEARARAWAESARRRASDLTEEGFFRAFPFRHPGTRSLVAQTLSRYGF